MAQTSRSSPAIGGAVPTQCYSDVIVGALYYDNGESNEGRASVYHGSPTGLSATAGWTAESDQAFASFGISVGTAGDVNADGYSDVIVGALYYDNGESNEGRAFVYHGSATGLSATAGWTAESNQAGANFGLSVGTAGDVNGDGYSDVIVGALFYDNGESNEGRAFVYHGSAAGLSATAGWTAESDQASALFGGRVGTAGDVNGDGYSDVIVGAYLYDNGESDEGRAFVYHGSTTGLSAAAGWTAESDQSGARFGISVGTAGDVNGDGYSEVIVGANAYDSGETDEGRAFMYYGSATGLSAAAGWTAESDQAFASFGHSVGTAGDVNGDGYSDVIVGARSYDNGETAEGRAFVYQGSSTGLTTGSADWTAEGDQFFAIFGRSVGTAGDVNGDGYSDVIVGANAYDSGETGEGRAFVYQGVGPPSPDLSIAKSGSPDPVIAGTGLTYTLTVTNNGTASATGVVLIDTIPTSASFVSSVPGSPTCTLSSGTVTCGLGTLAPNTSSTISILVSIPSSTTEGTILTNTAFVTTTDSDLNVSNNSSTATTTVQRQADLTVAKNDSRDPAIAATNLNYALSVTNNGPSDATNIALTDTLPPYVNFTSASQGCNYSAGAHEVACDMGDLASGGTASVTIEVTVMASSTPFVINNSASVTGNETDPIATNNAVVERTVVIPFEGFPGLTQWGLIAMAGLLAALILAFRYQAGLGMRRLLSTIGRHGL